MTAINFGVTPDGQRAFVTCDGLVTDPANRKIVGTTMPKCVWNFKTNFGVGLRGNTFSHYEAIIALAEFPDFDAAFDRGGPVLMDIFRGSDRPAEILICGWSEKRQRICGGFSQYLPDTPDAAAKPTPGNLFAGGWVPTTKMRFTPLSFMLAPELPLADENACNWPSQETMAKTPDALLSPLVEALRLQRRRALEAIRDGRKFDYVGGQCRALLITKDGCEERDLFDFGDSEGSIFGTDPVPVAA